MREFKIAAIPADGIGKEVIAAGLEVLDVSPSGTAAFAFRSRASTGGPITTRSTA